MALKMRSLPPFHVQSIIHPFAKLISFKRLYLSIIDIERTAHVQHVQFDKFGPIQKSVRKPSSPTLIFFLI